MTFEELIVRISEAYDVNGAILRYFNQGTAGVDELGDGLAAFIVNELCETHDPTTGSKAMLAEARRVMATARNQILDVLGAIEALEAIERRKVREVYTKATLPEDTQLVRRQREGYAKVFEAMQNAENSTGEEGEET